VHVPARDNVIVNRLNKTKVEKDVDHEQVRQERLREAGRLKKAEAIENVSGPPIPSSAALVVSPIAQRRNNQTTLRIERERPGLVADQKKSKRYENLFTEEAFEERARQEDSDDDFM
jgi:hypothetical protein